MKKKLRLMLVILLAGLLLLTACSSDDEEEESEAEETEETEAEFGFLDLEYILVTEDDTDARHDASVHPANTDEGIYCYFCYVTKEGGTVTDEVYSSHRHDDGVDSDSCYICLAYASGRNVSTYRDYHLAYLNQYDVVSTADFTGTSYDSGSYMDDGLVCVYLGDLDGETGDELLLVAVDGGQLILQVAAFTDEGLLADETAKVLVDDIAGGGEILSMPYADIAVYVVGTDLPAIVVEYSYSAYPEELRADYPDSSAYGLAYYQYDEFGLTGLMNSWTPDGNLQQVDYDQVYAGVDAGGDLSDGLFAKRYETNPRTDATVLATVRVQEDTETEASAGSYATAVEVRDSSDLFWIKDDIAKAGDYQLLFGEEEDEDDEDDEDEEDDDEDEEEDDEDDDEDDEQDDGQAANSVEQARSAIAASATGTFVGDPSPSECQVQYISNVTVNGEEYYYFLVTFVWYFDTGTATCDICNWYYGAFGSNPADWYEPIGDWQSNVTNAIAPYISEG